MDQRIRLRLELCRQQLRHRLVLQCVYVRFLKRERDRLRHLNQRMRQSLLNVLPFLQFDRLL